MGSATQRADSSFSGELLRSSIWLGLVIAITACNWTSIARAQTYTSKVTYSGEARVTTLGALPPAVDFHSDQKIDQGLTASAFLQRTFFATQTDANTGTATGTSIFDVLCYAQPGTLRVHAVGLVGAKTTVPYNFAGSTARAGLSVVSASWARRH